MRSHCCSLTCLLFSLFCLPCLSVAQDTPPSDPLELSEAVFRLEQQLNAQSIPERDAAEKRLIAWGLPVLDHLSPIVDSQTGDLQQRLLRIRSELEKQAIIAVTNPSKLQLEGELSLVEALRQIQRNSGNKVTAEPMTKEKMEQKIAWDGKPMEFWDVIRRLQKEYDLVVDPYGSEKFAIGFHEPPLDPNTKGVTPVFDNANVLCIELNRVDSSRVLAQPSFDRTTYGITIRWEPRLRPISIDIPRKSLKVVDQFDQVWTDEQGSDVYYGMVQPEFLELEYSLTQPLVSRKVEEIKSLSGIAVAVLPGRIESFQFPVIGQVPPDTKQTKGGATVTYDGMLKLDDLFGARIGLSFSEENNALESHQSWAYQNECYLETKDGRRIDAIGSETYQQENTRLGVMFLFPEYPADAKLIYRTPAAIVKVEIPFELKGIKLP
jgi:hypothetical protein